MHRRRWTWELGVRIIAIALLPTFVLAAPQGPTSLDVNGSTDCGLIPIGSPISLELTGPAGLAHYWLFHSDPGPTNVVGVSVPIGLSPGFVDLGMGNPFPATGMRALHGVVPNDVNFVGQTLYSVAAFVDPNAPAGFFISNGISFTFTGAAGAPVSLVATSFQGFPTQTGGGGPNAGVPLPEVFRDQALSFTFAQPLEDCAFGGYVRGPGGQPLIFTGSSPSAGAGVPYYAYQLQGAARTSFDLRPNEVGGQTVPSYIIGRAVNQPDTLVLDPVVAPNNLFGLPPSGGLMASGEYVYRIPVVNELAFAGGSLAAPVGPSPASLPLVLPTGVPVPALTPIFRTGGSFAPSPPPAIVSITALSGATGVPGDPISATDTLVLTFSQPIDPVSIDVTSNFTVRNLDLVTAQFPNGPIVPGNVMVDPVQSNVVTFTPTPSFGPGVSPTQGYNIQVRVGSFADPAIPPILGVPQGPLSIQLPLSNSLESTFLTAVCPTCQGTLAVIEPFADTNQRDSAFAPLFQPARWNDPSNPSVLSGTAMSGSPLATFQGNPAGLGTRTQVNMPIGPGTTLPLTTVPFAGLFSPFDDAVNNLGPGVNPAGGSHIMHLVESVDLGSPRASLELVEWGPVFNTVFQSTYPQYQAWCGMTSIAAPINCPPGFPGMSAIYRSNYNIATTQPPDPAAMNPSLPGVGGVLVTPPSSYNTGAAFTSYFPFPVFSQVFDYLGAGPGSGNLIIEQNIEPGNQVANYNRYRATNFIPARRLLGAPLSSGVVTSAAGGCDIYDLRFTFTNVRSSSQSLFYDLVTINSSAVSISVSPSPANQPPGTSSRWEFEGASAISAPGVPFGPTTGFLTWWDGTPGTGQHFPSVLGNLAGRRYLRFRTTLRNDHLTNAIPSYSSLILAVTF